MFGVDVFRVMITLHVQMYLCPWKSVFEEWLIVFVTTSKKQQLRRILHGLFPFQSALDLNFDPN